MAPPLVGARPDSQGSSVSRRRFCAPAWARVGGEQPSDQPDETSHRAGGAEGERHRSADGQKGASRRSGWVLCGPSQRAAYRCTIRRDTPNRAATLVTGTPSRAFNTTAWLCSTSPRLHQLDATCGCPNSVVPGHVASFTARQVALVHCPDGVISHNVCCRHRWDRRQDVERNVDTATAAE
jgi:hypothetical protein